MFFFFKYIQKNKILNDLITRINFSTDLNFTFLCFSKFKGFIISSNFFFDYKLCKIFFNNSAFPSLKNYELVIILY